MTPEAALLVGFVLLKEVRKTLLQEKLPQVLESGREKKKWIKGVCRMKD